MKQLQQASVVVFMLVLTVGVSMPAPTFAAPKGNAWGYYGMAPGQVKKQDSLSYRSYRWRDHDYNDPQEFRNYIYEYMRAWRELHGATSAEQSAAQVKTLLSANVEDDRATLRGELDLNDADYAEVWFEYGTVSSNLNRETDTTRLDDGDALTFDELVTDLDEDTRYYYRAVAEDDNGDKDYGIIRAFITGGVSREVPLVYTYTARNVTDTAADIRGEIDMREFENGTVFFVYGTDRGAVEDVVNDFDTYADIEEDDTELGLQKVLEDSDLDGNDVFTRTITSLEPGTKYFVAMGVEYENDDNDKVLLVGNVRSFTTDE